MSSVTTYNNAECFITLTGETTFTVPSYNSRNAVTVKNASLPTCTLSFTGAETADGATSYTLYGKCAVKFVRGDSEWVIVSGYDTLGGDANTFYGTLTSEDGSIVLAQGSISMREGTFTMAGLACNTAQETENASGDNFGNQPANDAISVVSDSTGDVGQTVTIIGTTVSTDTVVVETVTLNGTTEVDTVKTNWGVVLAVKLSAACAGTITIQEKSGSATITTIAAAGLSAGVVTVAADQDQAYGRKLFAVAGGASTKQIGFKGLSTAGAVAYDSQALNGTTKVQSNSTFSELTEIYIGDIATATATTVTADNRIIITSPSINFSALPTASTGLSTGDLWTNSNVLTIA